jgi:hypothetical protein
VELRLEANEHHGGEQKKDHEKKNLPTQNNKPPGTQMRATMAEVLTKPATFENTDNLQVTEESRQGPDDNAESPRIMQLKPSRDKGPTRTEAENRDETREKEDINGK